MKHQLTFSILFIVSGCCALKNVSVNVPKTVLSGKSVTLLCQYDLDGEQLYSVKWYKGRHEFYRYTPQENPRVKTFPILGIHVDDRHSNATQVVLNDTDINSSGRYSCEVSADAPSFQTYLVTGVMEVVEVPHQKPRIAGLKLRYRIGDRLQAKCISGHSRPPANLTWYFNDKLANPEHIGLHRIINDSHNGLRSELVLNLIVEPHHLQYGKLKVRCVASIRSVYWQSNEKTAEAMVRVRTPVVSLSPDEEDQEVAPSEDEENEDGIEFSSANVIKSSLYLWMYINVLLV